MLMPPLQLFSESVADELSFQLSVAYRRGGDTITLRASSARERHIWVTDIESASRKCKEAEKAGAFKARATR
jgi:actin cytoskeleton-regulatory complex protein PAN1